MTAQVASWDNAHDVTDCRRARVPTTTVDPLSAALPVPSRQHRDGVRDTEVCQS
jgi:hypothetical protein